MEKKSAGRPRKLSLDLRDERDRIPDIPENREQRNFLLRMILQQQRLEQKKQQRFKKEKASLVQNMPQNPGAKAWLQETLKNKEK